MSISLVVADDHQVIRCGVANLLEGSDINIVGDASNGDQAIEQVRKLHPDVVLMDVRMPERDGLSALRLIREESPETRVVMYSTFDNPTYIARSMALGASDYVLKNAPTPDLVNAIRRAVEGTSPTDACAMAPIARKMNSREVMDSEHSLTRRECQVLRHIALGLSNREIGEGLGISVETVKEHVQNLLRKMKLSDRTQAAVWATRKGMV